MSNKQSSGRKRVLTIGGILLVAILLARLISGWIGGPVHDFIAGAFPWVMIAIGLACAMAAWTSGPNKTK